MSSSKEKQRQWRLNNPDFRKKWQKENPDKLKEIIDRCRSNHKEERNAYARRYYLNNRKRCIQTVKKRQSLKRSIVINSGSHTLQQWEDLKKQCDYRCTACNKKEPFTNQIYIQLTKDHIVPLSKGGTDLIDNIQPMCFSCNCRKGAKNG